MKSFKPKAWMLPQPVLIIGTYDKDGRAKDTLVAADYVGITFDPCHFGYIALGDRVGNAFADGKALE